ncbi:MAG: bifunctional 5,10-methylenetetrahydrofolate dehydrogenase/5,10-methenyltetrahydrofolate cyclohydrolase [Deltaproteobacteria bacterium]|nr:bifunctional 5,10-methylenetetrahydrofolate dehydrogenase/5,10-methenyltetrahydrofolate cyclohydrolase [Deltaproteobacteria bacterium]
MPLILEGKKVADAVYSNLSLEISLLPFIPKLVFLVAGENAASQTYVRAKAKKCEALGLRSETLVFPQSVSASDLVAKIRQLNEDRDVHGMLVQLPLPSHLSKHSVLWEINPLKDVDGLHPDNAGRLAYGEPRFIPCTPAGILEMLKHYKIQIEGAKAVVVGRSEIVGKPLAQCLLMHNATVTLCHSKTRSLEQECRSADILVVAMDKAKFVGPSFVKEGAAVIDVGIHREGERLVGDVDFEKVSEKVAAISPVPGGVGPMTIAMLMKNLAAAASLQSTITAGKKKLHS